MTEPTSESKHTRLWAALVAELVETACHEGDLGSIPGLGRSPEKGMATHSSVLAGEFYGQRSLAGYSPWGRKELDTTEHV